MTAIDAEVTRDQTAQFTMIYGETNIAKSNAFKPMASAVGKGYRQDYQESNGNPHADLVVVLPPVAGVPGQTVVRISADPARADALLKGTKLREASGRLNPPERSVISGRGSRRMRFWARIITPAEDSRKNKVRY